MIPANNAPNDCEFVCKTKYGGISYYKQSIKGLLRWEIGKGRWVKSVLYRDLGDLYDSKHTIQSSVLYLLQKSSTACPCCNK